MGAAPTSRSPAMAASEGRRAVRSVAFYLPQYHPTAENDAWWGAGFTDWINVVRAAPRFRGHYQPHLPADLGFYDLRSPETREAQAELARSHGVDGFCYYHYWFNGRPLLERPFNEVLASGKPDFPFLLCWANENWTRVWDGGSRQVLIEQRYSEVDDRAHIRSLLPAFGDRRYITVDGRPVFLVYRAGALPDPSRTTEVWRQEAAAAGLRGLYLCRVDTDGDDRADPRRTGFDAAVEFQPDTSLATRRIGRNRVGGALTARGHARNFVMDYADLVTQAMQRPPAEYVRFPCVMTAWDNSARRHEGAWIFHGSTPDSYGSWLRTALDRFEPPTPEENLVFTNAWNEWAEGNHLEPDQRWGRGYLEAHAAALAGVTQAREP